MKPKFLIFYLKTALELSNLSYAKRLKVGSLVVKDGRIISMGYNGTPSGWENVCEDEIISEHGISLKTRPETIHAEMNALLKLARSHESGEGAVMFCTHSPCIECAKGIYGSGISEFYYIFDYRDNLGIDFLRKCNVLVDKVNFKG